jgi:hypothetical protein
MSRWWAYGGYGFVDFRPEIGVRPPDLTERVRTLEARLRATQPSQLTADEERALQSLLWTVHRLTAPSLSGRG